MRRYGGETTLAMRTDLMQKTPLVVDACNIDRPLRMTIGISDRAQSGSDSEPEQQGLQLPRQSLAGGGVVHPYRTGLGDGYGAICGPQVTKE